MVTYSYDRRATAQPTYPDGRLIPQPGDRVYQQVPGFGQMPTTLYADVSRDGKRVKVTGSVSLLNLSTSPLGKTYKLTPAWTVVGDPSIEARAEARKKEQAEKVIHQKNRDILEKQIIEDMGKKRGWHRLKSLSELHPGDLIYRIQVQHGPDGELRNTEVEVGSITTVEPRGFLYMDDEGHERTSGNNLENWWVI